MAIKYSDPEYASERLGGSLVRHNGIPVIVDHINEEGEANVMRVGGDQQWYHVDHEELDLTPVPLGVVNLPDGACYVSRMPKRRDWRQGLRRNNMRVVDIRTGYAFDNLHHGSRDLVNTILGNYPSLQTCVEEIECGEATSRGFSRWLSVHMKEEKGYRLYCRTTPVGWVNQGGDGHLNCTLDEEYKYMQEFLQQELKIG